ncbi:MAG: hypothetical protein DRI90_02425 [Deltaproteobacteria bacterium]|nr:MAG: hypothetical protein DRI90_02425 [Deltaproteobacteria bacterium]
MARTGIWLLLASLTLPGCAENGSARPQSGTDAPSGSASAPTFTRGASSTAPSGTTAVAVAPSASALEASPTASASASADLGPLPDVEVTNIGMHIGGEANTAAEKQPIREAVHKHYDDFRRCYGKLESPPKEATFGVDMRIEGAGGHAKISNPRNTFDDDAITSCFVAVFETVDFPKSKKGIAQMVSFSLRFRRK